MGDNENIINASSMNEVHWIMEMLHHVDVGIVVVDKEYNIQIFNSFMENHSGFLANQVKGKLLFELFEEIPEQWFKRKAESVFLLKNKAFTLWENRPYLFKFESYRPITSRADYMYQNTTFMPLFSTSGEISHLCLLVYDVTETALSKMYLEKANQEMLLSNQTDKLTSLLNRSCWENILESTYQQWVNKHKSSVLVMIDIDQLSDINELYGYSAGDGVLVNLAKVMKYLSGSDGICGRYAGSQLGIVLSDMSLESAKAFAMHLSERVKEENVCVDDTTFTYTVSIGMAVLDCHVNKYQHWLRFAYKALFLAKKSGFSQVVVNDNKPERR